MKSKTEIMFEDADGNDYIFLTNLSPSEFDIKLVSNDKDGGWELQATFNFVNYGQIIKSFFVLTKLNKPGKFFKDENAHGWEVFHQLMYWTLRGYSDIEARKTQIPAKIWSLYYWRFCADARDKVK